jgi:hypothetical protein
MRDYAVLVAKMAAAHGLEVRLKLLPGDAVSAVESLQS